MGADPDVDVTVLAGAVYFDGTTKTATDLAAVVRPSRNHFLFGRKLLWQSGIWRKALSADAVILEFNPRILSNWGVAAVRRLLRRRTVFWGHAWPRSGRGSRSIPVRSAMLALSDAVVVYTETQARELRELLPHKHISAAPNALYPAAEMQPAQTAAPTDFIYVGRLVEAKKPQLLINAFVRAADLLPAKCRLIVVGDGPERGALETAARPLADRIVFKGHISDVSTLRSLYANAVASVSPGYVGLSITQSLSFGVPMIVARNEPHAPEIEATEEGVNSVFFEEDNEDALAETLTTFWQQCTAWLSRRDAISASCRHRYSIETMSRRLLDACLKQDTPTSPPAMTEATSTSSVEKVA
jgi:glycosyltransferase involved in cell wall biosynthesis